MTELQTISWIGCGKVGRTLAKAFRAAGYGVGAVICRHKQNAQAAVEFIEAGSASTEPVDALDTAKIHFITASDDAIQTIAEKISAAGQERLKDHYFFHTSGSKASTILESLQQKGAEIGSIHPLQVFANPVKALETLPGIYYAIEGTDRAMVLAVQLVDRLKGQLLLIPTGRKVHYHVAGVFASNYLTVLVNIVLSIMEDIGEDPADAYQAFLPLMVGALQNIEEFGTADALTGPIARGDVQTIENHLKALQDFPPEIARIYKVLGEEAVALITKSGKISAEVRKQLLDRLK